MPKRQIFYSFHFDNDVMRVQQIRNIGALEDNPPASVNDWEQVKRRGESAIKKWIDDAMNYRSCVVVLIGTETARRKWVNYEIEKAWNDGRGLLGIHIHNLNCPRNGTCAKGPNPFYGFNMSKGGRLSDIVACYDPPAYDAYNHIRNNLEKWIEAAIAQRQ
jgi:hypothetical protein